MKAITCTHSSSRPVGLREALFSPLSLRTRPTFYRTHHGLPAARSQAARRPGQNPARESQSFHEGHLFSSITLGLEPKERLFNSSAVSLRPCCRAQELRERGDQPAVYRKRSFDLTGADSLDWDAAVSHRDSRLEAAASNDT